MKLNFFDFLMFDFLEAYFGMDITYPKRLLYIFPFCFAGLLLIGFFFVLYKSLSTLTNPFIFIAEALKNYRDNARNRDFSRKSN